MCGGSLNVEEGVSVAECEFCGSKQTLPKLTDEKRANLYDRANHYRRNNDYDKAMAIYEQILNEDPTDAESYWSVLLCRYGVDYVEDPATHKRIPTVNRAQYTSVLADQDYKSALEHADGYQREIYEAEAKELDKIQKGILAISKNEEPFDVFICYKETDSAGRRTPDSVLAQELYYGLKNEGFKVFFSRITLEDKLGSAYEPYIFAALNSSKVMVALGTRPEYFSAVWVKNEWSRYLSLIKNGEKKILIPAYKDMDPYNLPEEFSHLQAQDMSKLGFMQDLIRGIKKIVSAESKAKTVVKETTVVSSGGVSVANLLKRCEMFLSDRDFDNAKTYAEKALDMDPENADAYLYKLLWDVRITDAEGLSNCSVDYSANPNYKKAYAFGNDERKSFLAEKCKSNIDRIKFNKGLDGMRSNIAEMEREVASIDGEIGSCNWNISNDEQKIKHNSETVINNVQQRRDRLRSRVKKGKIFGAINLGCIAIFVLSLIGVITNSINMESVSYYSDEYAMYESLMSLCTMWLVLAIFGAVATMVFVLIFRPERAFPVGAIIGLCIASIYSCGIVCIVFSLKALTRSTAKLNSQDDSLIATANKANDELRREIEGWEAKKASLTEKRNECLARIDSAKAELEAAILRNA